MFVAKRFALSACSVDPPEIPVKLNGRVAKAEVSGESLASHENR